MAQAIHQLKRDYPVLEPWFVAAARDEVSAVRAAWPADLELPSLYQRNDMDRIPHTALPPPVIVPHGHDSRAVDSPYAPSPHWQSESPLHRDSGMGIGVTVSTRVRVSGVRKAWSMMRGTPVASLGTVTSKGASHATRRAGCDVLLTTVHSPCCPSSPLFGMQVLLPIHCRVRYRPKIGLAPCGGIPVCDEVLKPRHVCYASDSESMSQRSFAWVPSKRGTRPIPTRSRP